MASTRTHESALLHVPVEDAAEAFVEMLVHNGIEHIFINSGTDTFPIQEAVVRMNEQERPVPRFILCIDEVTAMFAAQGYFQRTGRPQVVLVHVDAGTAQIGGAYHDVQRDRSGVIVCAGRAPTTIGNARPGSKDMVIHWGQEQLDQHGIVRTFTKWDYELRSVDSLNWVVQKAVQVATSEPAGPVYLTLPRELLMTPMESVAVPPPSRHAKPIAPAPDLAAIDTLAEWLVCGGAPADPGRYARPPPRGRRRRYAPRRAHRRTRDGRRPHAPQPAHAPLPERHHVRCADGEGGRRAPGARPRRRVGAGRGEPGARGQGGVDRHRPVQGHHPAVVVPRRPAHPRGDAQGAAAADRGLLKGG